MLRNIGGPFFTPRTVRGQKWLNAVFGSSKDTTQGGERVSVIFLP